MTNFFALIVLGFVACASAPRPRIDRAADLPPRRYPVPPDVGRLVVDAAAFADFARAVRAGIEEELGAYDLRDREALKERLFVLALLDALDDRWRPTIARLDAIAALESKPAARAMTGVSLRVWSDALAHGGDTPQAFRAALERRLAGLDLDEVRAELGMLRAMGRTFTPEVCRGLVEDSVGAEARGGSLSLDSVHAVAFQRYAVVRLVPVGGIIDDVLASAGIALPDD